ISRTLSRIAHEVIEGNDDLESVALVGIHTRGVPLAQRLRRLIAERSGVEVALGAVDITFHRDDVHVRGHGAPLHAQPVVRSSPPGGGRRPPMPPEIRLVDDLRPPVRPPRRHLISIGDLTRADVERILATARALSGSLARDVKKLPTLRGRTIVNLFYESSTRTSSSSEL